MEESSIPRVMARANKNNLTLTRGWSSGNRKRGEMSEIPRQKKYNQTLEYGSARLHEKIFSNILTTGERKTNEFKTLRQALGYSLSVVICAFPKEGFEYMQRIADSHDNDILWVIRENLKKNRLVKNFPDGVAATKELLP